MKLRALTPSGAHLGAWRACTFATLYHRSLHASPHAARVQADAPAVTSCAFRARSADASARRVAAEGTLSSALGAQVAEAMAGRGKLDAAQALLHKLQARLREIDALCAQSRDLIRHDDLVRQLATVRTNFDATLSRATTILDLPEEAADTLAALAQESELVVVFEELVALDAKCVIAQRLFEDGEANGGGGSVGIGGRRGSTTTVAARNAAHRARVASYFGKVDAARETFEEKMWGALREAVHLGDSGSAAAVRVLRVVQEQEAMDAQRSVDSRGAVPPRRYRAAALAAVEAAIDERCATLLPADVMPPENEDGSSLPFNFEALLSDVKECFHGVADIYDFIVPCFPTDYDVWQVVVRRYHARLVLFYDRLAALPLPPNNTHILALVACHESYVAMMFDFGVPDEWVDITPVPMPYEAPPPAGDGKKGGRGGVNKNVREAVAAADAEARARAKEAAAAAGGNWEGAAVVSADATARALLTGIALDTAGLTVNLASGLAYGTMGVVKSVGNLVTGKGLRGGHAADDVAAPPAQAARATAPSSELWVPGTGGGLYHLLDIYVKRMRESTATWMTNMVAADLAMPPAEAEGGRLWTPAGTDFFRILNDQLEAVTAVTRGELLVRVVVAISALMLDFQRLQNGAVERPLAELSLEVLCAYVNNNERCYDLSNEMLEGLKDAAPDEEAAARLEVLEITDEARALCADDMCARVALRADVCCPLDAAGLPEHCDCGDEEDRRLQCAPPSCARRTCACYAACGANLACVRTWCPDAPPRATPLTHTPALPVFADPGFASVFAALFTSADWWSGATCDTLCATIVDYFGDLAAWLTESFFKRVAEAVMERTVASYCAALFTQCASIKTGTMTRIAADEEALRATFQPYCREAQLATAFQSLTDLRDLACASTEAEIGAAFGTMLTNTPGTTVDVVERILAMRDDIPKPVKKQIVHACAEQWHHRNGTTAGGLAGAAAALGGATLATAAAISEAIKAASKSRWFG
jgi:exocyst complex component 3